MDTQAPVIEISGSFADEVVAQEAADALNRWFRWIVEGTETPAPEIFEPFGLETAAWAWSLEDDVDWKLGPHARVLGPEIRISLETHDTYRQVAGLLKRLGALTTKVQRG